MKLDTASNKCLKVHQEMEIKRYTRLDWIGYYRSLSDYHYHSNVLLTPIFQKASNMEENYYGYNSQNNKQLIMVTSL